MRAGKPRAAGAARSGRIFMIGVVAVLAIVLMAAGAGAISACRSRISRHRSARCAHRDSYLALTPRRSESVTQIIEQQLTGIDGCSIHAKSSSRGSVGISAVFEEGTDPETAQVRSESGQQAISRLHAQVQQQGVE